MRGRRLAALVLRKFQVMDEGIVQRRCACAFADGFGRVADKHAAFMHQRNPVAARGLGHVVGRDKDRYAVFSGQVHERLPEDVARHRIDARGRLIQDQNLRAVDQCHGQR